MPRAGNFEIAVAFLVSSRYASFMKSTNPKEPTMFSINLTHDEAEQLILQNGWTIEKLPRKNTKRPTSVCYVKPGATRRRDGGKFGQDFLWCLDEAATVAIRELIS